MNEAVVPFQRKILSGLANLEAHIGKLYESYATLFPSEPSHWKELAKEEREHSAMLISLNKELDDGHLFWNIGKFSDEGVAEQLSAVEKALQKARDYNVTEHEAFEVAVSIEKSLLEGHFYTTVISDSKVFPHIAKALATATEGHLRKLQNKILERGGGKVWI